MDWVLLILLFLHVAGAVLAFGPTFTFPILGPMAGREPQHVSFALRFQQRVARTLIVPLALFQGVTGLLLVWRVSDVSGVSFLDVLSRGWLLTAIVLYVTALALTFGIGLPTLRKLIEATSAPPPTPPPGGEAPHGPPPHIAALAKRGRQTGMIQSVLILAIIFLMVTKPF